MTPPLPRRPTPPAPTPDSNIKWRAKDFGATIWPSAYDIMYRILQLSFTTFYAALVNWLLRHSSPPYFRFWVRLPAVVLYGLFGIFRLTGPKRQPLPCTDDFHEVMFGLPIPEARHRDVVLAFGACMVALAATLLPTAWLLLEFGPAEYEIGSEAHEAAIQQSFDEKLLAPLDDAIGSVAPSLRLSLIHI